MIERKHCPFCGENRQEFIKAFYDELHYLRCENCAATGPGAATKEEAIIAWNNRAKHSRCMECHLGTAENPYISVAEKFAQLTPERKNVT